MKKNNKRIIIGLLLVVFIYIAVEVFQYFYNSYDTEIALTFSADDSVQVDGVFIREETVITTEYSDNVHYLMADGSRVSKSYEVAEVYSSASDADIQLQINALKSRKSVLEDSQDAGALASYDVDIVSKQIDKLFGSVYDMSSKGNMSTFSRDKNDLLVYLNRRRISLGIDSNYNEKISEIDSQISSINSQISNRTNKVTAPTSGFFVSGTDGYEGIIRSENFSGKSYDEMYSLIKGEQSGTEKRFVGKIITDYTWNYAFTASENVASRLRKNTYVYMGFSFNGSNKLKMLVEDIVYNDDKSDAVIILSCDEMSEYISSARYYSASLIFSSYEGLKINKSAIRMKDETKGVYIRIGNQIRFKKLNVIYETNDYVISTKGLTDSTYLQLYDEIVVDGKNLYDGKHIN